MLKLNGGTPQTTNDAAFKSLSSPSNAAETGALKIARTVVKNLFTKGVSDDKFRTLKTTNPKIAAKLLSQPQVVGFLIAVGFTNTGEALTYQGDIDVDRLQQEFQGIDSLLRQQENTSSASSAASVSSSSSNNNKKAYIDPTRGTGGSIKAQMRAKEALKEKSKREAERKRRKALLKGFETDKKARKAPGWEAKLSGANKGAAPSMQGSAEGNANLNAH